MNLPFDTKRAALNGVCPYFTMFPLDFPIQFLVPMPLQVNGCLIHFVDAVPPIMPAVF